MEETPKPETSSRTRAVIAACVIGGVLAGGVAVLTRPAEEARAGRPEPTGAAAAATAAPKRRETRPTLDPARFTGKAALAYQVARDIPAVLDQLHCYCDCGSQFGHVSLLSCYVDGHGST